MTIEEIGTNMKHIAAALALSLSVATSNTQAAEVSADLGAHIQQVLAEIHVGDTDWSQMVERIDQLVAQIDQQILDGTGDHEELSTSRLRLVDARAKINQQHLTAAQLPFDGQVGIGGTQDLLGSTGGFSSGGSLSSGTSHSGGGGGGGGGMGGGAGLGGLVGLAAVFATIGNDNNNSPGFLASPSTP
jgi:hypothetical protein